MRKAYRTASAVNRTFKYELKLKDRIVCYEENGHRTVPLEKTIKNIERFFLKSPVEVQFTFFKKRSRRINQAYLKYHSPSGKFKDQHYFGKGLSANQNIASTCFEFFERLSAQIRPGDLIIEASFNELIDNAIDPRQFSLPGSINFHDEKTIDWIRGYSLSRKIPVWVPANLVFCPYSPQKPEKYLGITDSNGLAAGNNIEEAILHGLLEVIERDQIFISEYNRLPFKRITRMSIPAVCKPVIDHLEKRDFQVFIMSGTTDIPVPFLAAFIHHNKESSECSVAYGCHLDPTIAVERALTEAIQLLPPSYNHTGWYNSGAPQFYSGNPADEIQFDTIKNKATVNIRENIKILVSLLKEIDSEVIVVDLSRPDIPFAAVRVLATKLQPYIHKDAVRLSDRFFNVPVKLGFRRCPVPVSDVKIWPVCGYK
ncbi:MAG: YcaO-like family protein [Bacteroidales bacterium]|nr:YcaO-like family protein [Bacteroidales bacterium]